MKSKMVALTSCMCTVSLMVFPKKSLIHVPRFARLKGVTKTKCFFRWFGC